MSPTELGLQARCVNTIRGLSMDAVQKANSGHPGLPLGAAAIGFTIFTRHLQFDPRNPNWFNRDRFILSAGHGSMLLYSLLHLTGYDLPLEQLKQFRQWGSMTPGHPENLHTPGVEMATGPLGQGLATAVGMASAEQYLAAKINTEDESVIDHMTYVLCSDGDLMEGLTNEACSLAGHLKLGKLIVCYDDNSITIDGSTDQAFTENVSARFEALGWHVQKVDGMDVELVDEAIKVAKSVTDKPSLIQCKTVIGFGSPNKAGTSKSHGSPLGPDEVKLTKEALGIPTEPDFLIEDDVLAFFRLALDRGDRAYSEWIDKVAFFSMRNQEKAVLLKRLMSNELGSEWLEHLPSFDAKLATRKSGQEVINAITPYLPNFVGGSADLAESNLTYQEGQGDFQANSRGGKNFHFGIREHAMGSFVNGLNLHGGLRAFGATFLIFSDYMRPTLRLAALMECPSIFVFTHDSIGVGEDGPTHEPVEHLMSLRLIPNFNLMRPCDGNETAACWKIAVESTKTPCALALSRQALPPFSPATVLDHPCQKGAYVLRDGSDMVFVATGSEVQLAMGAADVLAQQGITARVVSMPSMFLFAQQDEAYRIATLPKGVPTVSIEAGATLGWERYADLTIGLDRFGASAPGDVVMRELGFSVENVVAKTLEFLRR